MSEENKNSFEKEIQALIEDFGWTRDEATKFLNDKVEVRQIQIDGRLLPELITKLCKVGIPFNPVIVNFLVPKGRWKEFEEVAEKAVTAKGGFLLRSKDIGTLSEKDFKLPN